MFSSLRGKQIVLAGGTGGLGSETARLLAAEGATVVAGYLENAKAAEALSGIAQTVAADLTTSEGRKRLLDAAPELYGLAVFTGDPARAADPAALEGAMRRSFERNFLGPVLLAREAAERMRAAGTPGAIVLIGTMQAVAVFPGSTAYASQKSALISAARVLAKECRGANIRVNVVCPGVTRAGMALASIASGKYDRYLNEGAIPRFGETPDVARAVRFFLEPDNYTTGQVLTVDGGLTL
ncbi:MAG: SDR family NAD(P)-dependent oxidoreductase [Rhodospirillales bacterium]